MNGYGRHSVGGPLFGLSQKPMGASKILEMFDNVSQPIRGLFGRPDKLLWQTKYDNIN